MCGGTSAEGVDVDDLPGLSPRVRGNLNDGGLEPDGGGSIPACAGEPDLRAKSGPEGRVYPRVCGGTRRYPGIPNPQKGLSPRVRGNLRPAVTTTTGIRSIPACAGEPLAATTGGGVSRVYPRVCGGTAGWARNQTWTRGLSPRVRGNLLRAALGGCVTRSIPACAGEPGLCHSNGSALWVYPRVCGGTIGAVIKDTPYTGLSPRVRGNLSLMGI